MVALKIEDVRPFTSKLFVGDTFEGFLVREASIATFNAFHIDGHIRPGYYTEEEMAEGKIGELSSWKVIRPICFTLIKGRKLPGSFQIVLQLSPEDVGEFLSYSGLNYQPEQIGGLYVNIRYEENLLYCITGTSVNVFTLDKSLEREWDNALRLFLKKHEILFSEE